MLTLITLIQVYAISHTYTQILYKLDRKYKKKLVFDVLFFLKNKTLHRTCTFILHFYLFLYVNSTVFQNCTYLK